MLYEWFIVFQGQINWQPETEMLTLKRNQYAPCYYSIRVYTVKTLRAHIWNTQQTKFRLPHTKLKECSNFILKHLIFCLWTASYRKTDALNCSNNPLQIGPTDRQ